MNTFDKLVEKLTTDETKQRLKNVYEVISDIVKTPQPVTITEDEESIMTVVQENGVPMVKMSRGFLVNLGNFKLTVRGGFTDDTVYEPEDVVLKESFTPNIEDHKRLVSNGYILIEKADNGCYHFTWKNGVLDVIKDFNVLNHVKHNDLNEDLYKIVVDYLVRANIKHYLVGDVWPEKTCEKENVKIQYVDRPVISEKVVYVDKIVLKETPIYVDKIVLKEVYRCEHSKSTDVGGSTEKNAVSKSTDVETPETTSSTVSHSKPATKKVTTNDIVKAVNDVVGNVVKKGDVKKVTIDTKPVVQFSEKSVNRSNAEINGLSQSLQTEGLKQKSKTLPAKVVDPDEDVDDKKPESSTTESEEEESTEMSESSESSETSSSGNSEGGEDEELSSSSSSSSSEKEPVVPKKQVKKSPPKRTDDASESVRVIKGRYLNDQKSIIKSGDYVYRLIKKVEGQSDMAALGRWDEKRWKKNKSTIPLTKEDEAKILKMGNKIARQLKK